MVDRPAALECRRRPYLAGAVCLLLLVATAVAQADLQSPDPAVRRAALISLAAAGPTAIEQIARSLDDRDPLVRRRAVLCLGRFGAAALPALISALDSPDFLVRRNAALVLADAGAEAVVPLGKALADDELLVRQAALYGLAMVHPRSSAAFDLIRSAAQDPSPLVQQAAIAAADQYQQTVEELLLPNDGWRFRLDPERVGMEEQWFAADLDDSDWADIAIAKAWGHFGYRGYIGVGWYRRTITLPENPGATGAVLWFGGVDECAWVWVNGRYAGEHDIGPSGWDKPFRIDVTDLIRWGEDNQITVRAMNTAAAGGIWQPITLGATRLAP